MDTLQFHTKMGVVAIFILLKIQESLLIKKRKPFKDQVPQLNCAVEVEVDFWERRNICTYQHSLVGLAEVLPDCIVSRHQYSVIILELPGER